MTERDDPTRFWRVPAPTLSVDEFRRRYLDPAVDALRSGRITVDDLRRDGWVMEWEQK